MNLTRRRFLAGASALMAAPLLAGLWPRSALAEAISQAMPQFIALRQAESGILTGAHWGAFEAIVRDGKMVDVRPIKDDPYPNELITMAPYQVHAENRIKYPMVRKRLVRRRGRKTVSQSCAAAMSGSASAGIKLCIWWRVKSAVCKKEHGPSSIYAGSYGWKSSRDVPQPENAAAAHDEPGGRLCRLFR